MSRFDRQHLDNKIAFNQYHYAAYLSQITLGCSASGSAGSSRPPPFPIAEMLALPSDPASIRSDEYLQWRHQGIPMSRAGHPDHVCEAIGCILANEFITGQILFVDGGEGMNAVGRNTANFRSSAAAI